MVIEELSKQNLKEVAKLVLNLWTESTFEEEYKDYNRILKSKKETCFLVIDKNEYIGFIHLSLRSDYVEGATSSPINYIEGIYVNPKYRKLGVAKQLVEIGEKWGKEKGCTQYASDTRFGNEESIGFHKKSGFKEVNRVICFIKEIK